MSKKALELKPVDPKLLATIDRIGETISGHEFFLALLNSLNARWKLRKGVFPENPPQKEITDYECGGCGCMVNPNVHGDCPRCFSPHIFYVGHETVLPSIERPKTNIWG